MTEIFYIKMLSLRMNNKMWFVQRARCLSKDYCTNSAPWTMTVIKYMTQSGFLHFAFRSVSFHPVPVISHSWEIGVKPVTWRSSHEFPSRSRAEESLIRNVSRKREILSKIDSIGHVKVYVLSVCMYVRYI